MSKIAPTSVITFLYGAIMDKIEYLLKVEDNDWSDFHSDKAYQIKEAIEWYKTNCVISSTQLQQAYDRLSEAISDKFIFNANLHHRYTLKYKLMVGKEIVDNNCLIEKAELPYKEIKVGLVFKTHNGSYAKIAEVFDVLGDKKFGTFVAHQLSVHEQLEMKKHKEKGV